MLSILISIFLAGLILSIYYKLYFLAVLIFLLSIGITILSIQLQKIKKLNIKKMVEEKKEKHFINVNKDTWQILEEIPHISRVDAKKAVFIRNKFGKYKSAEDFVEKMKIENDLKKDIIYFICV